MQSQTIIYADVLFSLNLIINYFLLFASLRFSGRQAPRLKILIASALGALYSFIIFIPLPNLVLTLSKPLVCALMVSIAVRFAGIKQLLKDVVVFFGVNFVFAGLMFALWLAASPDFMFFYNGIVYFNITAKTLIISTVIAYIFTEIAFRVADSHIKEETYNIKITRGSKSVSLKGFLDSGNTLSDPFTATPVIMTSLKSAYPILSANEIATIESCSADKLAEYGIKVIPCRTVESYTLLPVIHIDCISFEKNGRVYNAENVLLGISKRFSPPQEYDVLLNPKVRLIPSEILTQRGM